MVARIPDPAVPPAPAPAAVLAWAFSRALRRQLSLEILAEIDAANATSGTRCASLDWTDADEAMDDAFVAVTGHAANRLSAADNALRATAWDLARRAGFAVLAREAAR